LKFSWAGVRFRFFSRLDRGHVQVELPTGRADIFRYAVMIAAAPALNLAIAVTVFCTLPWDGIVPVFATPASALWLGWGCANLLLVQYATSRDDVGAAGTTGRVSDGKKLSMIWRAPHEFMAKWRLQNHIAEAIAKEPGRLSGKQICAGQALLAAVAPAAEYASCLEALIRHPRLRRAERTALLDLYCTWALFRGEQPYLGRAVVFSEQLFSERGSEVTVQGTRGSMLAVAGRTGEASAMLRAVVRTSKSRLDHAIATAVLAWLEHRRGNVAEAAKWSDSADQWNDGRFPIAWMAIEMGRLSPPPPQSNSTSV
jgi:hypothetical protein